MTCERNPSSGCRRVKADITERNERMLLNISILRNKIIGSSTGQKLGVEKIINCYTDY